MCDSSQLFVYDLCVAEVKIHSFQFLQHPEKTISVRREMIKLMCLPDTASSWSDVFYHN